jgi:hypothetical protein
MPVGRGAQVLWWIHVNAASTAPWPSGTSLACATSDDQLHPYSCAFEQQTCLFGSGERKLLGTPPHLISTVLHAEQREIAHKIRLHHTI